MHKVTWTGNDGATTRIFLTLNHCSFHQQSQDTSSVLHLLLSLEVLGSFIMSIMSLSPSVVMLLYILAVVED